MNMNNTKTLAIVAVLTAATLVLGGTLTAASAQSVFLLPNIGSQNDGKGGNGGGGGHPTNLKKGAHDNGKDNGKGNGNTDTDTIQKCKQFGSGLDPTFGDQNCEININSNIGEAAVTPVTPPIKEGCPAGTVFDVTIQEPFGDFVPSGSVICLTNSGDNKDATILVAFTHSELNINNSIGGNCPEGVRVLVDSGKPPSPFHIGDIACVMGLG
jgi:hypothetical protein